MQASAFTHRLRRVERYFPFHYIWWRIIIRAIASVEGSWCSCLTEVATHSDFVCGASVVSLITHHLCPFRMLVFFSVIIFDILCSLLWAASIDVRLSPLAACHFNDCCAFV